MYDDKRLIDREACRLKSGLSEMKEMCCHRQQGISLIIMRRFVDRFEKPVALMSRQNFGGERRSHDNFLNTDCFKCFVQFLIEILHPANGTIAVL
jgi:hypothetical protein